MNSGKYAFCAPVALIRSSRAACNRSQIAYPHGRITMVPRTGPFSASSARATTSWYQRGKSVARGVSVVEAPDRAVTLPAHSTTARPRRSSDGRSHLFSPLQPKTRRNGSGRVPTADVGDLHRCGIGVRAGFFEQRTTISLGFFGRARVCGGEPCFDTLGHQSFGLLDQGLDHLVLGNDPYDLATDEKVPFVLARGDPEISAARLPRPVHDATHDCHLDRQVPLLEGGLRLLGDRNHIDLRTTTRRTGDEIEPLALAKAEGLEQLASGARFFDRISRQRVANGVADAFRQQRSDANGSFDQPTRRRSGFGDPEVKGMVEALRRKP